jgi:hypothetical protein
VKLEIEIKTEGDISNQAKKVIENIKKDLQAATQAIGQGAYQQAHNIADQKMSTELSSIYKKNLYIKKLSENAVEIGIKEEAFWIENGKKGGFMEELLNHKSGSPPKVSKEGHKYRVIPFEKSTTKKSTSSSGEAAINELKTFLRKENIRYSKTRALALDEKGSPRIGRIHSFDIKKMRENGKKSVEGLSRNLQGLSIYQNFNPQTKRVERNIMTFRVISEKHRNSGKWQYPANKPKKEVMKDVFRWVEQTWQSKILPELKAKYEKK